VATTNEKAVVRRAGWRPRLLKWLALVLLLTAFYLTRGWTLPAWGRWLDASEPPHRADYAMVLTGGENTRPFVAAGMHKNNLVGGILIARMRLMPDQVDGIVPPESDLIRSTLIDRGVPAEKVIILPGEINSTADEALALARFLDDHPNRTVAIVTNDFHTRRAPTDDFSADNWWHSEAGFMTYLGETVKSTAYALR
jgi:uncharacterized SAM-binding protein YcdF (DUF218 family)